MISLNAYSFDLNENKEGTCAFLQILITGIIVLTLLFEIIFILNNVNNGYQDSEHLSRMHKVIIVVCLSFTYLGMILTFNMCCKLHTKKKEEYPLCSPIVHNPVHNSHEVRRTLSDSSLYSTAKTSSSSESIASLDNQETIPQSQYNTFEIYSSTENKHWTTDIKKYKYKYIYISLLWCVIYIILYPLKKWFRNTVLLIGVITQLIMLLYIRIKK